MENAEATPPFSRTIPNAFSRSAVSSGLPNNASSSIAGTPPACSVRITGKRVHTLDHVVARGLAELVVGGGDVEKVVDDLEHDAVRLAVLGERVGQRRIEPGDQAADARRRRVQRCRLAADRRHVARLRSRRVVGVAQFLDLPFAQPADRAGEQTGNLGAERGGDSRGPRQQEIARENRLQVPPLRVDGFDAAPGAGLVHHVVVVERSGLHQFTSDPTLDRLLPKFGIGRPADLRGDHRQHRAQALATSDDQVRRDLVEVRVGRVHRLDQGGFDALHIVGHPGKGEEGRRRHAVRLATRSDRLEIDD